MLKEGVPRVRSSWPKLRRWVLLAVGVFLSTSPSFVDYDSTLPLIAITAALGLLLGGRQLVSILRTSTISFLPILLMLALMWLSSDWSEEPTATLRSALSFSLVFLIAMCLVDLRSPVLMIGQLGSVFAVLVVFQAVLVELFPGVGLVQEAYEFGAAQGSFLHRNYLAFFLAVAFVVFLARIDLVGTRRGAFVLLLLLDGWLVWRAQSQTIIVLLPACIAIYIVARLIASSRAFGKLYLLACVVLSGLAVGLVVASSFSDFAADFGRDGTLTGRTSIWAAAAPLVEVKPLWGWGWQSVWSPKDTVYNSVLQTMQLSIPNAHSGYLDFALQLGYAGVAVMVTAMLVPLLIGLRQLLSARSSIAAWVLTMSFLLITTNITDTRLTREFGFLVLVIVTCAAVRFSADSPEREGTAGTTSGLGGRR